MLTLDQKSGIFLKASLSPTTRKVCSLHAPIIRAFVVIVLLL